MIFMLQMLLMLLMLILLLESIFLLYLTRKMHYMSKLRKARMDNYRRRLNAWVRWIRCAVDQVAEARAVLKTLGECPDHETIITAKAKLAEIDSSLANQLREIVLSPRPTEFTKHKWIAHLARQEKECRDAVEKDRKMYNDVITHISSRKKLDEAEANLLKIRKNKIEVNSKILGISQESLIQRIDISNSLLIKCLPDPTRLKWFLHKSNPKEVIVNILVILSRIARMDKELYDYIDRANIWSFLKDFLINQDPDLSIPACRVFVNICYHSSHFYSAIAEHRITSLVVDLCAHSHRNIRNVACLGIQMAALHNDLLYDELRRCIPQLAKLLYFEHNDVIKDIVAEALSNLVLNSNKLSEDMVSTGAMKALLDRLPSKKKMKKKKKDVITGERFKATLLALNRMCDHLPCREFLLSSHMVPIIRILAKSSIEMIANTAIEILRKVYGEEDEKFIESEKEKSLETIEEEEEEEEK